MNCFSNDGIYDMIVILYCETTFMAIAQPHQAFFQIRWHSSGKWIVVSLLSGIERLSLSRSGCSFQPHPPPSSAQEGGEQEKGQAIFKVRNQAQSQIRAIGRRVINTVSTKLHSHLIYAKIHPEELISLRKDQTRKGVSWELLMHAQGKLNLASTI